MPSILSDLVSLLFYVIILVICCGIFYLGLKKDKESPEYQRRILREQITSSLEKLDRYIRSLSSKGIEKKVEFVNEIITIRSRPAHSSVIIFEQDLRTCIHHEEQARNISNSLNTSLFDHYCNQLISGSINDRQFSELVAKEKHILDGRFPQFNISEFIEVEKLKLMRKVDDRRAEIERLRINEIERLEREKAERLLREKEEKEKLARQERERLARQERLEKERLERVKLELTNVRSSITSSLNNLDRYTSNLAARGIKKLTSFSNQISTIRSRSSNSSLATFQDDLRTCIDHENQARNISDLNSSRFDVYIDQLFCRTLSDRQFSDQMDTELRNLSRFTQFNFSEFIEREKLRIVRAVEDRRQEANLREQLRIARQDENMIEQLRRDREAEQFEKIGLTRQEYDRREQLRRDREAEQSKQLRLAQEANMREQLRIARQDENMIEQLRRDREAEQLQLAQEASMREQLRQDREVLSMQIDEDENEYDAELRRQLQRDRR